MKMKFKKIIAVVSAVAMLAANAFTVSAENEDCTYITGGYYAMPVAVGTEMTTGNYEIAGTNGAKWIVETNGTNNGGPICKVVSDDAASGNNSLYLKANGNKDIGHGGAVWAIELPSECLRGTYNIQVDVARISSNWRDYIALNLDGWDKDDKSRLNEGANWTKGEEFAASNGSLTLYQQNPL